MCRTEEDLGEERHVRNCVSEEELLLITEESELHLVIDESMWVVDSGASYHLIVGKPVPPGWEPKKPREGNRTGWIRKESDRIGVNQKQGHISKYVPMCLLRLYL